MSEEQDNTILTAERAVKDNPSDPELQVALGMAYFYADRWDAAMTAFQQALALDPGTATAHNGIGRVHYYTGPVHESIAAYERAIALDPHYIDPVYGLGILYSAQLGDYTNAVAAFQRGLAHNPDDAFLTASLGSTYARMGRFDEAITTLQQVIVQDPNHSFAYSWLSILFLHLKRYDEAILACQREIEIEDAHSPRRLLGYIYTWRGDYDEAIVQLERSIALEPEDYEARGALAKVYRLAGRQQDAAEQYAIANAMAQRDNEYGQACFAAVTGDVDQALALLEIGLAKGQLQPGWARIDPEFAFMTDDPRFKALIGD